MQKKLQVFISSTFVDLQDERQAAVQAVLNAGHIPAGMELFKAGDQSQKETIKRWIEESDVYMLILGGRYGSIEQDSGKSYTHWEYDLAGELGKPRFAIVIHDDTLDEKVRNQGQKVIERENSQKYRDFRDDVLNKISKFYKDIKDIKLTVLESLKEYEKNSELTGWVSGKEITDPRELIEENLLLTKENEKLKAQIKKENEINGYSFQELFDHLKNVMIELPEFAFKALAGNKIDILRLLMIFEDRVAIGITNDSGMTDQENFFFFTVAPKLIALGLLEKVKVAGKQYQRIQTSKDGYRFLSILHLRNTQKNKTLKK